MTNGASRQSGKFLLEDYIPVSERIEKFYEKYPDGRIVTNLVEINHETGFVLMQAMIYRNSADVQPSATGHATEVRGDSYINKTSFVENAETSAVGRALALLGFEVRRGIASREEMEKVSRTQADKAQAEKGTKPAPRKAEAEQPTDDINAEILQAAAVLGYDAAKVRKWVNQRFEVTGGLESLTNHDKSEILQVFREKAQSLQTKAAQR